MTVVWFEILQVVRSASLKGSSTEDPLQLRTAAQAGGSGSLLRSGRGLRLGLGAVTRTATGSVKGRGLGQGQKSTASCSQPVHAVSPATNQKSQANAGKPLHLIKKKKKKQTTKRKTNQSGRWPFLSCTVLFHWRAAFSSFPATSCGTVLPSNWPEMKAAHQNVSSETNPGPIKNDIHKTK